jgi:hypothetical protein
VSHALIDLNDVCLAPGGAELDGYAAVRAAVRRRGLEVRAIGDNALRTRLRTDDLAHLHAAVRHGEVELVPDAAPYLLERLTTAETDLLVSNRRFRALRSTFPGLDGVTRVYRHHTTDGHVELTPAPFDRLGTLDVATPARLRALAAAGYLTRADHDLLLSDWRCPSRDCPLAASAPQLETIPRVVDATALCPGCGQVLRRLGPVAAGVEVALGVGGRVRQRVVVARGLALTLGRGPGPGDLDVRHLLSDDDGAVLVAREHLVVVNRDGRLLVRDAGSAAGSRLHLTSGEVADLEPGVTTVVGTGETVTLGGVLELTPVPRRWTWAATAHPETVTRHPGTTVPAVVPPVVVPPVVRPVVPPAGPVVGTVTADASPS